MAAQLELLLRRRITGLRDGGTLRVPDDRLGGASAGAGQGEAQGQATGDRLLDLTSNDYLGLGRREVSRETLLACADLPIGAGASRLIHGTHPAHIALEHELARWVDQPAALLFSSGYAANVGTLAALPAPGDLVLSDALNHASIIDGCRLSRARVETFPHRDLDALRDALVRAPEPGHRWVVTETYFSMDADTPDLHALSALCAEHAASLIVDEAHALGVFGPAGSGLMRAAECRADVLIGTLGKAIGAQGAFVAGSTRLRTFLWNRARSLVFSTAPSPLLTALTLARLHLAQEADTERERLRQISMSVRAVLRAAGTPLAPESYGPVVPILLGSNQAALRAAADLEPHGLRARAIRPPTVPAGTARLRVTLNATLDADLATRLARTLADLTGASCADS